MAWYKSAKGGIWLIVALSMPGCATTKIVANHPLVQNGAGSATVYFLRPPIERRMGFPDNPLAIDLNQEKLMDLGLGEYAMAQVIARDMLVTLRNRTEAGPIWAIKDMERQYPFTFKPGETYYLVIRPVDGEFRGVHFRPEVVDYTTARQLAAKLHGIGPARGLEAAKP